MRPCLPLVTLLVTLTAAAPGSASVAGPEPEPGVTRPAILVGNNWDGTTDVVDPETFRRLDRIDVIPDRAQREAEIAFSPDRLGFYLAIRELIGEGNHQFNDDVFSSHDGRTIFVSRPSFADVVAIDLETKRIRWRAPVDGHRADHMAISHDGRRLLVSASTGNVVHELDTETGRRVGGFPSGDSPHENVFSKDGSTVFHASIGRVYLPTDRPQVVSTASKGGEFFQVVDARTGEVRKRIVMGEKMAEAGFEGFSSAVRPMALSPDERHVYFQLSFFHGFVEYDLRQDRVTRVARLPLTPASERLLPEQYLLDSAHHGLAMDPAGRKLCVAGTMSDYAAIVDRATFAPTVIPGVAKPYWATNSADGRSCYVSASQADEVLVIDYATERVRERFRVGRHPQRVRNGVVRVALYPQGAHGEPFRLQALRGRRTLRMTGGDARVDCRARDARELRLARCDVRVTAQPARGARAVTIARGSRSATGSAAFRVDVRLTRAGRRLLARRPGGVQARLVARGTDSIGRRRSATRRIRVRG